MSTELNPEAIILALRNLVVSRQALVTDIGAAIYMLRNEEHHPDRLKIAAFLEASLAREFGR